MASTTTLTANYYRSSDEELDKLEAEAERLGKVTRACAGCGLVRLGEPTDPNLCGDPRCEQECGA